MLLQGGGLEAETGVQETAKSPSGEGMILMTVGWGGFQRGAAVAFLCTDSFNSSPNPFCHVQMGKSWRMNCGEVWCSFKGRKEMHPIEGYSICQREDSWLAAAREQPGKWRTKTWSSC